MALSIMDFFQTFYGYDHLRIRNLIYGTGVHKINHDCKGGALP
jgi:hypothetical protein